MDDKPGRARDHSQHPAGHRRASSGSWLSIIGLLTTRSLGIGASRSHRGGEAYISMDKRCIIIGVGISTTPARLALINSDVNDGDYIILVGSNSDAINALVEFTRT